MLTYAGCRPPHLYLLQRPLSVTEGLHIAFIDPYRDGGEEGQYVFERDEEADGGSLKAQFRLS
jgi:hypothetical protein